MTWDELVLILHHGLQDGQPLDKLQDILHWEFIERLKNPVAKHLSQAEPDFNIDLEGVKLEPLLKTLMARKLVKMTAGTYGSWSNPNWRFTPKGLQYLAELQAMRSEN